MGAFYVNITLYGPSQDAVAAEMRKLHRDAYVSPTVDRMTVLYDRDCDEQKMEVIDGLATHVSMVFGCPALAVVVHDDDVLLYSLYVDGQLVDEYNSAPDYFDEDAGTTPAPPVGGDAGKLCAAFEAQDAAKVEEVLRASGFDESGYTFETERHQALAAALGLPSFSVGYGYGTTEVGELPDGLTRDSLKHTG